MANASAKKQASVNQAQLSQLNKISGFIYGAVFLFFWVAKRPVISQLLFCTPGFIAQYLLYSWSRPKFDSRNQLISAGVSIEQAGLVEYIKDLVILTWGCALLAVVLGLKAWLALLLAPAFALYKAWQLLKAGKRMLTGPQPNVQNSNVDKEPPKDPKVAQSAKPKLKKRYV